MRVSEPPLEGEAFAEIELRAGDNVARLVERACEKFEWGVPTRVSLFRAAAGGEDEPLPDALMAAAADPSMCLGVGLTLARAGIAPGCWLLARVPPPAAAAPGAFSVACRLKQVVSAWRTTRLFYDAWPPFAPLTPSLLPLPPLFPPSLPLSAPFAPALMRPPPCTPPPPVSTTTAFRFHRSCSGRGRDLR